MLYFVSAAVFIRWHNIMCNGTVFLSCLSGFPLGLSDHKLPVITWLQSSQWCNVFHIAIYHVVVTLASMLRWIWPNLECNLKTRDSQICPHKRWPAYCGNIEGVDLKQNNQSTICQSTNLADQWIQGQYTLICQANPVFVKSGSNVRFVSF